METEGQIETPRFLAVAALTILVSEILVLAVREVAVRVLHPSPAYGPLSIGLPVLDTIIGVTAAIFVFRRVAPTPRSVPLWRYVATGALILSFGPDVMRL